MTKIAHKIAQAAAVVTIVVLLCYHTPKPEPLAPTAHSATRTILIRLYANTPTGPRYALVSDTGETCFVDVDTWFAVYVGEPHDCLWRAPGELNPNHGDHNPMLYR